MIPKGVRGNKRSRSEMHELEDKIRDSMYSENPRYKYEEILEILQIPKRTLDNIDIDNLERKINQKRNRGDYNKLG